MIFLLGRIHSRPGPHAARGPRVGQACFRYSQNIIYTPKIAQKRFETTELAFKFRKRKKFHFFANISQLHTS
jgi:hypothetical protein